MSVGSATQRWPSAAKTASLNLGLTARLQVVPFSVFGFDTLLPGRARLERPRRPSPHDPLMGRHQFQCHDFERGEVEQVPLLLLYFD